MDDDIEDYKLDTTFEREAGCVVHTSWMLDRKRGPQKFKVEDRWHRKDAIGVGSFGEVFLEATEDGRQRALKAVRKRLAQRFGVDHKRELAALTFFSRSKYQQYQTFVEFLGWFEDDDSIFLAMEYFPYGDLSMYKGEIEENNAKIISRQLLEGLQIMHEKGFTHRDLKPQNIFIVQTTPSWWVKIGDFGISKRIKAGDSTELRTATGAIGYEAPEIRGFIDDEANCESSVYTNLVDIWSFGCVIYKIMAKELPFQSSRDLRRFCERRISFPSPPLEGKMSQEGIEFLRRILEPSPLNRPSAAKALQYDWLKLEEIPENAVFDASRMPALPQAESNPQQPFDTAVPNNTDGQSSTLLNLAAPSPPQKATSPTGVEEQTCRVLYDFNGQGENELSLRKGEIVIVVQKERRGWWLVKRRVNDGWAPSDYLKEEKIPPTKTASPKKAEEQTCRALYDFNGQDENELSLRKGEIVIVVQKENRGWWLVKRRVNDGWAPSDYLEEVKIQAAAPSLAR